MHFVKPLLLSGALALTACNLSDPAAQPRFTSAQGTPDGLDMPLGEMGPTPLQDMRSIPVDMMAVHSPDMRAERDMSCVPFTSEQMCAMASACGDTSLPTGCGARRAVSCPDCPAGFSCAAANQCECTAAQAINCPASPVCGEAVNVCGQPALCLCSDQKACVEGRCEDVWLEGTPRLGGDEFGAAVLITGDLLVVGAPGYDNERGAIFVFRREGLLGPWLQQQLLTSTSPHEGARFGSSLAHKDDTIFVGAPNFDLGTDGHDQGSAVTFTLSPQGELVYNQRLTSPAPRPRGLFGHAIALVREDVLIGEPSPYPGGDGGGKVYRFGRLQQSWASIGEIQQTEGPPSSQFGASISGDGDWMAIGSGRMTNFALPGGRVEIFHYETNTWISKKVIHNGAPGFGSAVALRGDKLVVAASSLGSSYPVLTYLRTQDDWMELGPLTVAQQMPGLGASMALTPTRLLVGAPRLDGSGGAALYTFDASAGAWGPPERLWSGASSPGLHARHYGEAMWVDGDTAAIGAPRGDGQVHVIDL